MKKYILLSNLFIGILIVLFSTLSIIGVIGFKQSNPLNENEVYSHIKTMSSEIHSLMNEEAKDATLDYMTDFLDSLGFINADNLTKPSYQIQTDQYFKQTGTVQLFNISNLIITIPATTRNADTTAMVFVAHYDSVPMGVGANDNLIAVASCLEAAREYAQKTSNGEYILNYDLVFAIVDGEEFGLIGSELFFNDYTGYDNVVDRIKLAINLESRGSSETLILFQINQYNYNLLKVVSKSSRNVFSSSIANMIYGVMPNYTDYDNFKDAYLKLNFANIGGGEKYHTQLDNYDNLGHYMISQMGHLIYSLIDNTAGMNLNDLESTDTSIFYTYFNLSIYYTNTFNIVITILLIILIVMNLFFAIKAKQNKISDMLKAAALFLIILGIISVVSLGLYYILQLNAVIFNVIDINTIGKASYTNTFLSIIFLLFTLVLSTIIYNIFKKLLRVNDLAFRRVIAYIYALISIILSFFVYEASYLVMLAAFLLFTLELTTTLLAKKYLNIFKIKFDLLIFALTLPIIIPIIILAIGALGATMIYVFAIVIVLLTAYIYPTLNNLFSQIKAPFSNIARYCGLGLTMLLLLIGTTGQAGLSANLTGKQNINRYYYDDAVIYYTENGNNYIFVKDLDAYPYLSSILPEMTYDNKRQGYISQTDLNYTPANKSDISHDASLNKLSIDLTEAFVEIIVRDYTSDTIATINYLDTGKTFTLAITNSSRLIRVTESCEITFSTNVSLEVFDCIVNYGDLLAFDLFKKVQEITFARYNYIGLYSF